MKNYWLSILFLACFFGIADIPVLAKEWRGITPLRSTRADLTRLFGASPDANEGRANYVVEGEHAYIVFSTKLSYYPDCAKSLPLDTVMMIQVRPKNRLPLSGYSINEQEYRVVDPSSPPNIGYKGYINEDEGVVYLTYEGEVEQINYFASSKDRHLCPAYAKEPESLIRIHVDFLPTIDEYEDMRFSDEKARLDNFAFQMKPATKSKGYILVFPGGRITKREAQRRGNRAMNYLIEKRQVNKDKVAVILGPKQKRFRVQLQLWPVSMSPPTP